MSTTTTTTTTVERPICLTGGIDVGARSVKIALLSHQGPRSTVVATALVPISSCRNVRASIREGWGRVLAEASLAPRDVDCMASTGAPARSVDRVGHFYGHSTQARGARMLFPDATVALDVGANEIRCVVLSESPTKRRTPIGEDVRGRVQCRTLPRRAEVHLVQLSAPFVDAPPPRYLAARAAMLVRSLAAEGKVVLTGGMVCDVDFVQGLWSELLGAESRLSLLISAEAVFAGAYGAAILAARRFERSPRSSAPASIEPMVWN
jgi:activator of 2-hydroxyglutaryl-CoA dehydratase